MGCRPSALLEGKTDKDEDDISKDPDALALLAPPPKIPISIGKGVKKYNSNDNNQCVIFVFGGPGSMKGLLVEDMVAEFDFVAISTEEIVLNYLPNKVANTVETTQEIQDLLKTDTALLTLEWILHLMGAKLSTSTHQRFIIDIIPNLLSILKVDSFTKENYLTELTSFERRHPIAFALNFSVGDEELFQTTPGILAKASLKQEEGEEKDKKDKDKAKSVFTEGADEADTSRMKRRNEVYMAKATPFLAYFNETERCASLDIVTRKQAIVWNKLRDFLRDYGFSTAKEKIQVVLFIFDESKIEGLDPIYYKMLKVRLSSIISNRQDTLEEMIRGVRRYIRRSASSSQNHLVVLDCLNTTSEETYRQLHFLELRECFLDSYIEIKSTTVKSKPFKKPFKVCSTSGDAICLFAAEVNSELCKKIALCFSDKTDKIEKKKSSMAQDSDAVDSKTTTPNSVIETLSKSSEHNGASFSTITTGVTNNTNAQQTNNLAA